VVVAVVAELKHVEAPVQVAVADKQGRLEMVQEALQVTNRHPQEAIQDVAEISLAEVAVAAVIEVEIQGGLQGVTVSEQVVGAVDLVLQIQMLQM
jgi:hypothetical protein